MPRLSACRGLFFLQTTNNANIKTLKKQTMMTEYRELTPEQIERQNRLEKLASKIIDEMVEMDYPWLLQIDQTKLGDNPRDGLLVEPKYRMFRTLMYGNNDEEYIYNKSRQLLDNYIDRLVPIFPELREPFCATIDLYRLFMPDTLREKYHLHNSMEVKINFK